MMQSAGKKWWFTPLLLIIIITTLHLFSLQHFWVESIYSNRVFPYISLVVRSITYWLPFSIGDIVYVLVFIWVFASAIIFIFRKPTWKKLFTSLRNFLVKCLWVYLIFLLLWGLNYYRYGIGYKLQLYPDMYSTRDLEVVTALLRDALNKNKKMIDSLHIPYPGDEAILQQTVSMYDSAEKKYPFLKYKQADIKKMMFGTLGNYAGFLGYYNPFTGEAQVNMQAPDFIIPFTACHEIGHQLGFASESEASFVGYLAIQSGHSPLFRYSVYFDLFAFANGELSVRDSVAARQNIKLLDTAVKKDIATYRQYLKKYQNPLSPFLSQLYGDYLKVHNQPKGIQSYDEVVAWMVAYYKKYGKI